MTRDSRKRKRDELKEVRDLPEQYSDNEHDNTVTPSQSKDQDGDTPMTNDADDGIKSRRQKSKDKHTTKVALVPAEEPGDDADSTKALSKKAKNRANRRKKALEAAAAASKPKPKPKPTADGKEPEPEDAEADPTPAVADTAKVAPRFIVFLGNLPYTATVASLTEHLSTVKPKSIRLPTSKETKKLKGFAFVELPDASRMKTCLKLYHHSIYEGRKINVELTAGGGGKSDNRTEKLGRKNEKLNEERKRRFAEEMKEKLAKGDKVTEEDKQEQEEGEIHPSRRKRVRT